MPRRLAIPAIAILVSCLGSLLPADVPAEVEFDRDIKPLLSDRCYACHGPDGKKREADLRLDMKQNLLRESESGNAPHVITPGDPGQSELYVRISSNDEDLQMPPPDSKRSLSAAEIELIRRWIEQGAKWQEQWSFVPLHDTPLPAVANESWPRNEIDRFVLARLEREGLRPAAEAGRERLLRRVSFDLTGLPPTLAEIDMFLADESPEAYERVVDRYLKSDRYGERLAAVWLDVARYSDTYGYQVDRDRFVWPWRDWVVRAFNANMPYDEFITQQLAGDLLPGADDQQILATTFNRLHPQKVEGGSTPEEFRIEYVGDRTETFGTAVLGLTLSCSRCHDHKYDPILQKEYYQLSAFFDKIDEAGLYSYFTSSVPTPTLQLADDATKARIADVERRIAAEEEKLRQIAAGRRDAFGQWLSGDRGAVRSPVEDAPAKDANKDGPEQSGQADRALDIAGRIAYLDFENHGGGANVSVPGRVGKGVKLTGDDGIGVRAGNFTRNQPFSVALWINTPDEKQRAVVFHRSRAWTDAGSRGYQLLIENGRLSASLIHFWPGNAIRVRTRDKIPTGQWMHVTVTYDGSSRAGGLQIYLDGRPAPCDVVRDNLYKNITGGGGDNITIGERFRDRGFTGGLVDEFQVFNRQLSGIEIAQLHDGAGLASALATPAAELTDEQRESLADYYFATVDAEYAAQRAALEQVRAERSKIVDGLSEIMVMREQPDRRQTYVLRRGAYDNRGEPVSPETPAALPPFPPDLPRNRLGLARWLTAPDHPLTARVAVNRFWQMLLGDGLVRTPEDFGSQGQSPTHPELLDWLARDFVQHGWNVKRLLKQIVMSATYRQSSQSADFGLGIAKPGTDPPSAMLNLQSIDPENRLLARGSVYRMSAEMLRDNALAVGGLLVDKIGGEPARPYEVEASFKPVKRQGGEGLYRRSLYTYWKRTAPAPAMMTFDASKRDVCRVRRERTSSPLQALVLMNGPQFVEAARMLAQRLVAQHGDDTSAITTDMFRLLTSRRPVAAEQDTLLELYQQQLAHFEQHPDRAQAYLKTGDAPPDANIPAPRLAALGVVANALLNFDESVTKR